MFTIARCSISDIPLLVSVATQSYSEHYTYLWHDNGEFYINRSFNAAQLEAEMADANARFFLLYEDQETVGFMKLNIDKAIGNYIPEKALELERIYILKKASGRGLGKKAVDFVLELAKESSKSVVWLKSMDSSKAIDFYQQQGFVITGENWLDFEPMKDEYRRILTLEKAI